MDYPATGPNSNTRVPTTRQPNRGHRSVSYPVSKKGQKSRTTANTGFLGWSINKRPTYVFLLRGSPHFLFLPQVLEMTGLSTSTIYRWMTDGTFTKQIQLGSRSVVWNERDVIDWMNQQIATAT